MQGLSSVAYSRPAYLKVISNNKSADVSNVQKDIAFKATDKVDSFERSDMYAQMIEKQKQAEKQHKKAKRKQTLLSALQISALVASIALAAYFITTGIKTSRLMKGGNERLNIFDVGKEKGFDDLILPDELQKVVNDLKIKISRATELKEKGLTGNGGILLYGEPGGGKNTFVYALTKFFQEKFPGSELVMVDVNRFKGMYNGQTENSILNFIDQLKKKAAENPNRKLVVFLDEFDSIARKAEGVNSGNLESFQNAFKTTLGEIFKLENVQVVAATNKAQKGVPIEDFLDSAISNRFAEKIHIPLPTKEQMQDSFIKHFQKMKEKCVDKELLDVSTAEGKSFWNKICEYITNDSHNASYRDFNYILTNAKLFSESADRAAGSPINKKDLVEAVIKHSNNSNWDENLTNAFKNEFKDLLK